jgi:ApbE superfamily uncharacterized protein (UPF0280 family)
MYQPRSYRHWIRDADLVTFNVVVGETDLCISAGTNLKRKARRLVEKYRGSLEGYVERHPVFLDALEALPVDGEAPHIVKAMMEAAVRAGVGPMAAVAGAIAEFVGRELAPFTPEIIVENGGDIYLKSLKKRVVGIYAGKSPMTGQIGLEIEGTATPLGICTSSGTVGHSLSYGRADAVTALAGSAALADAAATAIANLVKRPADIAGGLERARGIVGLKGVVIIVGGDMGFSGEVKLCHTSPQVASPESIAAGEK